MSRDLVHWEYLPVAIPMEGDELIFSGGAVVDKENTSGFGTRRNPAMVAIYTSAYPDDQKQSLAYSTDRGRTWTKYARNPVLDDADREFRDPKVFWYAPERKWVMAVPDNGDPNTGSIVSPEFTIDRDYLNFEIAGGNHPQSGPGQTAVNLVVDGQVVRTATGRDSGTLNWIAWDVKDLAGKTGRVEIVDQGTGGWGHVLADHFVLSDVAAKLRSDETAVNLIVDGEVVRSTAGKESEALDWASWNVAAFRGREAQIQIVDRNSGGWGHILADQITLADAPAQSAEQRASWLDYGKDYYAAVSWNDVPDGRRLMIGWMNNWQYANQIPTSPWRSAMSVPREVALRTSGHGLELVQRPVRERRSLRTGRSYRLRHRAIADGTTTLAARGKALEIKASLRLGAARRAGLNVRTGDGEQTAIGYDAQAGELYVDRTRSGQPDFSAAFPGVQRAPLEARDGKLRLRILVDWSSVEVFAGDGTRVITDQIFPRAGSDGIQLFADGPGASIRSLTVTPLRSAWSAGSGGE